MIVKTGFGILIKDGKKLHKVELPLGEHREIGGYTYEEVSSKSELDKIFLDKSDRHLANEAKYQKSQELRKGALEKIKKVIDLTDEELASLFGA